jgi:hypothetical protein
MMVDVSNIEKRVDRAIAAPIPLDTEQGPGLFPKNLGEAMELAKLMAISGPAVPKYLRGSAGNCLAIILVATRWQMDPFAVASKSYVVFNKGEERVAYEAQLVHAVVNARAPIKGRLRHEIVGEGDERRCKVWGTFRGEDKPHVYESETLGKLRDARGRNDAGQVKGSPLWDTQPEVQLTYSAYRQWARTFTPETLLGVYAPDEFEDATPIDTSPIAQLGDRLRAAKEGAARGFDASHVARDADVFNEAPERGGDEPSGEGRQDGDRGGTDDADNQARHAGDGTVADPGSGAPAESQGEGQSPASDDKGGTRRKAKKA